MTFNNNNNRSCLDLPAAMATGISAEAVVVLMVSTEKQRGQLAVFVGWTCSHCFGGHLWSLGFHKKGQVGGSHL